MQLLFTLKRVIMPAGGGEISTLLNRTKNCWQQKKSNGSPFDKIDVYDLKYRSCFCITAFKWEVLNLVFHSLRFLFTREFCSHSLQQSRTLVVKKNSITSTLIEKSVTHQFFQLISELSRVWRKKNNLVNCFLTFLTLSEKCNKDEKCAAFSLTNGSFFTGILRSETIIISADFWEQARKHHQDFCN